MIPRYTPADYADLFSQARKYQAWFDVEVAACEAMEAAGHVPAGTAAKVKPFRAQLDADKIDEIEKVTRHDVIAFLTHVEELAGEPARWLHRGMTSSDVLDTSLALLLVEATEGLITRTDALLDAFRPRIEEHRATPMIGRSHGIHAEPLTFGLALAGHYAELARGRDALLDARARIAVGKISGAVGTYAHLSLEVEEATLSRLGLKAETVSTQVVARDRHAALCNAMALVAAGVERFAINVRHWQRTEVGEAEEHFKEGQKGSSAMPHKRNPVLTENLSGLARVVRGAVTPALENIGLWHERDISHSSVERMILPDATATLAFMLERATKVVRDLVAYPERMKKNLDQTGGLWASQGVLLALVDAGMGRQDAYVVVQKCAMASFQGEGDFHALLRADPRVQLDDAKLAACFDLQHVLRHVGPIIDRALRQGETTREGETS